jgi:hypothetical protein
VTLLERQPQRVADELRFDPWNAGRRVVPAGVLNSVRAAAYRGSRSAPVR